MSCKKNSKEKNSKVKKWRSYSYQLLFWYPTCYQLKLYINEELAIPVGFVQRSRTKWFGAEDGHQIDNLIYGKTKHEVAKQILERYYFEPDKWK